jgi:hypothetical protein
LPGRSTGFGRQISSGCESIQILGNNLYCQLDLVILTQEKDDGEHRWSQYARSMNESSCAQKNSALKRKLFSPQVIHHICA